MQNELTEAQAIETLLNEFNGGEADEVAQNEPTQEVLAEVAKQAEQAPQEVTEQEAPKAPTADEIAQLVYEKLKAEQPKAEPTQDDLVRSNTLKELGLSGYDELKAKVDALSEASAKRSEEERLQAVFNDNVEKLAKAFPTIDTKEFGKFANENGYAHLLDENFANWKVVGELMSLKAKSTQKPDDVISSGANSQLDTKSYDEILAGGGEAAGALILKIAGGE